ncbi:coiled-coil domain-containing protein [Acetobacter senegalensis]|uniref:hypothetical protein n=1 Tax=Acetobacter senegalensis TaxID=446692 RepID=UPI001EDFC0B8|nr:hypothetical protein [Acetobacter senegalensis]MCG4273931.1 hypothetical protein [Acetobacter senegalensis]
MQKELTLDTVETLVPSIVFAEGGVEDVVSKLEAYVRALPLDATTEKGRKHIKSVAYDVARSKTALDNMGKEVQESARAIVDRVNADRRVVKARLDTLRDEVKAPVVEFEQREAARVEEHQIAIRDIEALARFDFAPDEETVSARQSELERIYGRDFEEFKERAKVAFEQSGVSLSAHAEAAKARRLQQEEAERKAVLEAEEAGRRLEAERIAREERIAQEAAERSRVQAEQAAQAERERLEREAQAAVAREQAAAQAMKEAQARAEREKAEAARRAEEEKERAVQAERERVAAEKRREEAEAKRRATDRAHKSAVNNAALLALVEAGASESVGKAIVKAIALGKIPHVSINY